MSKSSHFYHIYAASVVLAGVFMLIFLSRGIAEFDPSAHKPSNLILWAAMISIAAMSPIPLPRSRSPVHATAALDLAAVLVFGPGIACWLGVLARFFSGTAGRWNPLARSVSRLGTMAVAIGAAGIVYLRLGGEIGADLFSSPGQTVPVIAATLAYFLMKTFLQVTATVLETEGSPAAVLRQQFGEQALFDVVLLPLAWLVALTHVKMGPLGVGLFLIPLLMLRYVFNLWIVTKRAHIDTVRTLMSAVDASSAITRGHSYRISKMCMRVARKLGMPEKDIEELEYAALLHDIGRTMVRHDILTKPGKLTEKEHSQLRTHPKMGHDMLRNLHFFDGAAEIVFAHHEQPDGKGYPRGLTAEEIPMGSRIIMVVAAFDAMTSDRPYRRGLAPEAALEELLAHSGTQFFPDVVEALIELYSDGSLFEEFEPEELERYSEGQCNSRAVEGYFTRTGRSLHVPHKRGLADPDDDVPVIDFPAMSKQEAVELEYPIHPGEGLKLFAAGLSDIGNVRENNEDSFGIFAGSSPEDGCLLVLADGMGGAVAGEVASKMAVDAIREGYFSQPLQSPAETLREVIQSANRAIHTKASSDREMAGMGTTCTAVVVRGQELVSGHVGDSRAYLVAKGSIQMLTRDHTLAAELERVSGSAMVAPVGAKNVLTRCLGNQPEVQVELSSDPIRLEEHDVIVLCSDGLSNLVGSEDIQEMASRYDPREACRTLIEIAKERGGPDNITVLVARVSKA